MSCSDSWCLKLVREICVSSFSDFCSLFQSLAAENCKERPAKHVEASGIPSEITLLDHVQRVGVATVTSELRYGGALPSKDL